ncbi:M23 family metallopeptidase [Agromyces sp. NPDC057679]|uniref:M23 family metallopeptidase n=1 Tax=Agromyces sp. NPDC057679 TaxID=3346207 RepID=UPI00366E97C3
MKPNHNALNTPAKKLCAITAVTAAALTLTAAAPQSVTTAFTVQESPTWSQIEALKGQPEIKAQQVDALKAAADKLSVKAEEARAVANAATAALVDAVYELPDPGALDEASRSASAAEKLDTIAGTPAVNIGGPSTGMLTSTVATADTNHGTTAGETAEAVTPEERVKLAAETQQTAEQEYATAQVEAAQVLAQIRFLAVDGQDPSYFQRSVDDAAHRVASEAATRLVEQKTRKQAEEAARLAAIEAARWQNPGKGRISDVFGPREIICSDEGCSSPFHRGTDVATGCDAPILAARRGTVVYADYDGTHGNFVLIDHGDGLQTGYAHIAPGGFLVYPGQQVSTGQQVAISGTTGASDGCHLHFEVYQNGNLIDPQPFMAAMGSSIG